MKATSSTASGNPNRFNLRRFQQSRSSSKKSPVNKSDCLIVAKNFMLEHVPQKRQCDICCDEFDKIFVLASCLHAACLGCWREYLVSSIREFKMARLSCLQCDQKLDYSVVYFLLVSSTEGDEHVVHLNALQVYDKFLFDQYLRSQRDLRWCPNNCGFGIIAKGYKNCPRIDCPECINNFSFCYNCGQAWTEKHDCTELGPNPQASVAASNSGIFNNWAVRGIRDLLTSLSTYQPNETSPVILATVAAVAPNRTPLDDFIFEESSIDSPEMMRLQQVRWAERDSNADDSASWLSCTSEMVTVVGATVDEHSNQSDLTAVEDKDKSRGKKSKSDKMRQDSIAMTSASKHHSANNPPMSTLHQQMRLSQQFRTRLQSMTQVQPSIQVMPTPRQSRRPSGTSSISSQFSMDTAIRSDSKQGQMKPCPRCKTYVLKLRDGSCNHVECPLCRCEFCWLCLREINCFHYISLSGCTFWGRKPWSMKRRIFLVFGLALVAPVLLVIMIALAIPCICFGLPIYVGVQVEKSMRTKPRKAKFSLIAFLVSLTIIVAPSIAALVCLLLIILMLGCVYFYMPIATIRFWLQQRRSERERQQVLQAKREAVLRNNPSLANAEVPQGAHSGSISDSSLPDAIDWGEVFPEGGEPVTRLDWDRMADSSRARYFIGTTTTQFPCDDQDQGSTTDQTQKQENPIA